MWLCEAPVLDIVKGWLDGTYSLRSVVRALHETRGERGWPTNLTETINELAMDDRRSTPGTSPPAVRLEAPRPAR